MAQVTTVIRNARALHPNGEIVPADVALRGRHIVEVGATLQGDVTLDAEGGYLLPGLIDLHTHGIRTQTILTGSLEEYARIEAERGTTTFYPTVFGASPEEMAECLRRHRAETDELRRVPQAPGFRLEGPYLQPGTGSPYQERMGLGLESHALITPERTRILQEAGAGHIRIWDIAPELEGAAALTAKLASQGIVCSICHTKASIAEARAMVDAGARLVAHLFDTFFQPAATDPDPGVYPAGLVDYLLVEDRVACEIIGDGTHVHPLLVEVAFRCKPPDRLVFITDSNYGADLPPGEYVLPDNGERILVDGPDKGVRELDREMELGGSALTPIDSFRNCLRLFGKDMATASRVWSWAPARLMGLNKGEIAPGRDADLIVLDEDLEVVYTIVAGEVVYHRA